MFYFICILSIIRTTYLKSSFFLSFCVYKVTLLSMQTHLCIQKKKKIKTHSSFILILLNSPLKWIVATITLLDHVLHI